VREGERLRARVLRAAVATGQSANMRERGWQEFYVQQLFPFCVVAADTGNRGLAGKITHVARVPVIISG
jgi:hypothetical protein